MVMGELTVKNTLVPVRAQADLKPGGDLNIYVYLGQCLCVFFPATVAISASLALKLTLSPLTKEFCDQL